MAFACSGGAARNAAPNRDRRISLAAAETPQSDIAAQQCVCVGVAHSFVDSVDVEARSVVLAS